MKLGTSNNRLCETAPTGGRRIISKGNPWKMAVAVAAIFFTCACEPPIKPMQGKQDTPTAWHQQKQAAVAVYDSLHYQALLAKVQSGDLVVRLGTDMVSALLAGTNPQDKSYSHAGWVFAENDSLLVYHAQGDDQRKTQGIRRETLYSFCHPEQAKKIAIYRPQWQQHWRKETHIKAKDYYARQVPFDYSFSLSNGDSLYCSEFVAACLAKGTMGKLEIQPATTDSLQYLPIENLYNNTFMHRILSLEMW